jgi:hypothetical protein
MSNVLAVNLYGEKVHVVVNVKEKKGGTFTLAITVNDKAQFGPQDGFASPQEALDYAARHYTGYPLSGSYVESGVGELDESAATVFVQNITDRDARAFNKFLAGLQAQYGVALADEAEHRTAHAIWGNKGKLRDAVIAVNRIRNGLRP